MKLFSQAKKKEHRSLSGTLFIFLSFLLPMTVMLVCLAGLKIAPFGDNTLVISDANGYYINTLSYAGRMYKGLEGLTYSFEKTLGGNMAGHLNGILLTPFGFLFSLVSPSDYPIAFTFISVLNFSLCGLTMYLLLADIHGHNTGNLIFSTTYALIGFNVANVFQAVFFYAAAPLPLMVLGLRKLFQGKSPLLYILTIAYSLFIFAYFGFITCVASVLFFFTGLHLYKDEIHRGRLFLRYALSSLCGGLIPCILWLPGFLSLQGGRLDQTSLSEYSLWENMPLIQIGAKLFTGANSVNELVNGLPNIFVGILPLVLVLLFFNDKTVDRRRKSAAGFLLGFYLISFWITALNMAMHGGTTTNWFNYRYSYVFSFLLLLIADNVWQHIDDVSFEDFKRCIGIMVVSTVLIFAQRYGFVKGGYVLLDYILLMLIVGAWRMRSLRPQTNPKRLFEIITLIIVCINLFMNYRICIKNIQSWGVTLSEYRDTVDQVEPMVQAIKTSDDSFFRMEVNRQRSGAGNDPMFYGYNGVGHGGSYERDFVMQNLNQLGIPWFSNRCYYADGIPAATDTLLGIKYVIAEEDLAEEKGYTKLTDGDSWNIYANPNVMPIAMLSVGDIEAVETDFTDIFENLNRVWTTLSGMSKDVFVEQSDIHFTTHNLSDSLTLDAAEALNIVEERDASYAEMSNSDSTGEASAFKQASAKDLKIEVSGRALKEPPENQSYIEYNWTAMQDGRYYSYNRSGVSDDSGSREPVLQYEGYYHKGDTVTGYLPVPNNYVSEYLFSEVAGRFRVACADEEALVAAYKGITSQPVMVEKRRDDHLIGQYYSEGPRQLLFTIPKDNGWSFYVDGIKNELQEALGVFMVADVPKGTHTYEMRFIPQGLQIGKLVSTAALVVTLIYLIFGKKKKIWAKIRKEVIS